jgi:hypothetical protein
MGIENGGGKAVVRIVSEGDTATLTRRISGGSRNSGGNYFHDNCNYFAAMCAWDAERGDETFRPDAHFGNPFDPLGFFLRPLSGL